MPCNCSGSPGATTPMRAVDRARAEARAETLATAPVSHEATRAAAAASATLHEVVRGDKVLWRGTNIITAQAIANARGGMVRPAA